MDPATTETQSTTPSDALRALITAGSILLGQSKTRSEESSETLAVIKSRLQKFNDASTFAANLSISPDVIESANTENLKLLTATKSLEILERVQSLLQTYDLDLPANKEGTSASQVAVGARDLAGLRTLASIAFDWGVSPLLATLYSSLSVKSSPKNASARDNSVHKLKDLAFLLTSLLWFSDNTAGTSAQTTRFLPTHITKILVSKHIADILRVCISVGWASGAADQTLRRTTTALLETLPASQAIVSLGMVNRPFRSTTVDSESGAMIAVPAFVQKAVSRLLSQQVLRPDGIVGLCAAMFGEGDEVAPLVKLEGIARVLNTVPSQMTRESYMRAILPNLVALLGPVNSERQSQSVPISYKRAVGFTLSRILATSKTLALSVLSPMLHEPLLPLQSATSPVSDAIFTLTSLFTSTDPSPELAQTMIRPILVPLYSLSSHLSAQRVSDPALKEGVYGLMKTWGRLVSRDEAVEGLWEIVLGKGGWGLGDERKWEWGFGEEGLQVVQVGAPRPIPLSMLQGVGDNGELGSTEDDNPLSLRPNPTHFAGLLESLERKDVASALFVRILSEYQVIQRMGTEPLRGMLFLKLVLNLQQKLGPSVFTEPEHILQFIAHALEPGVVESKSRSLDNAIDSLRIVETDSDDEICPVEIKEQDEMASTAVALLLSVLEANENLSTHSSTVLAMVFDYLEPLTNSEDEGLRALAREARLVLISRRALGGTSPPTTNARRPDLETYQEALRLIQDPILPVRAHGLHMLRQLVVPAKRGSTTPELDPALVPGILDVFLQSVQEEDSFIFLNAVQGLSAMVDRLGREILQNLVRIYASGIELGRLMERAELDKRVRVGEALVQVVRKYGDTLSLYIDMLVPPLFRVIRADELPTVLRSSALSILAQCAETSPLALTPWMDDVLSGMMDILQLESVRAVPLSRAKRQDARSNTEKTVLDQIIDARPHGVDSKLPPFRRSALLCLALVVRSMIVGVYEGTSPVQRGLLWNRARNILDYLRLTDSDPLVRVQAAETLELVKQLGRAELGLE